MLKPKHSGFFDTTLDTLLESLRVRRVILTGIAGNICVLFTANDAYMRELKVFAPADCIVSNTAADNDHRAPANRVGDERQRHRIDATRVPEGASHAIRTDAGKVRRERLPREVIRLRR